MLERFDHMLETAPGWVPPLVFLGGVLALLAGGNWLVDGAVRIARRLGVSTLLIGLTVVAFGTSAPELALNLTAALNGNTGLSFGNVVGSNIANIGMVLGLAALIRPLAVHSRVLWRELPLLLAASIMLLVFAAVHLGDSTDGFSRVEGVMLVTGFTALAWLWYRLGRSDRADPLVLEAVVETQEQPIGSMAGAVTLFVVGLVALLAGGKLTEAGAVAAAERLGLSQAVIGVTIVAIATSLPEAITSVVACRRGHGDLAVGNVVGSNLFNILLVLGATCLVAPVPVPTGIGWLGIAHGWWDLIVMLALTAILVPIGITGGRRITRLEGGLLLGVYVTYLVVRTVAEVTSGS